MSKSYLDAGEEVDESDVVRIGLNGFGRIGGTSVPLYNIQSPSELPWGDLDVDVAFECTGIFRTKDDASQHLEAGAEKVVISAPPKGDKPVKTLVYGVNHDEYEGEDIVSNASCTTNSVTPV